MKNHFQKNIKYLICIGLCMLWYGFVSADNIMQINSAQVQANQQVSIQIVITNSNPFVAFQVDIPMPAPFTFVANSTALNPARSNGHLISATLLTGNILRIIGFSFSNSAFAGNSGVIASFNLNASTLPGDYALIPTNAIIGNSSSTNILTGVVNGTLTLLAPNISLNVNTADFGQVPLGNTSDRNIIITNTGNQNLQINTITFNSPYFTVIGNTAFSILPYSSTTVTVRFTSAVKGNYLKIMTITSNDPDQLSSSVSLQAVAFAVNEVHCGNMFGFSGNQANLSLSVNNMEFFCGFQFDLQLPAALTYQQGSVQLTNRKSNHVVTANVITGNILRIIAFSPNNQTFSGISGDIVTMNFLVNGTGGYYPLSINNAVIGNTTGQNIISASYNGSLEIASANIVSNTNLNYGNVSVFDTAFQTLRIYNYGNDTLKVNQLQFTNSAFSSIFTLPVMIDQGSFVDIQVLFHPVIEGQITGTMNIFSNDPDENPKVISLSGNCYIPNYLSVMDTTCFSSDTVTLQLSAENYETFTGFQTDISFPASMTYVPNSVSLTNRSQGHIIQASLINSSTLRVVAFSMQQLPFTGNAGALVRLKFAVNVTGPENALPVTLSNAVMGNSQLQNILYGTNNGVIHINALPPPVITSIFTATISNQWENTANWDNGIPGTHVNAIIPSNKLVIINSNNAAKCNNLTIEPLGMLTINAAKDLIVNGTFTLQSNVTGTASFINNGLLNSSENKIECYIPVNLIDEFHILASPVDSQKISNGFSPENQSFFAWNETNSTWIVHEDVNFNSINGNDFFTPGKGYAVSYPVTSAKNFIGTINTGTISTTLTYTSGMYSGWHLLGNPYPSAINWKKDSGFSRTLLEDAGINEYAFWIWNPVTGNYGTFISNGITGTNGVTNFIPSAQGFWVKTATAGNFSINNNACEHASQLWLKNTTTENNIIRLKVSTSENNFSDELIVSFGNVNDMYGAEKMFSMYAAAPGIFSKKLNKNWSIDKRNSVAGNSTLQIGFKPGVDGNYNLSATGVQQFGIVILEDLKTGIQQNLSMNSNYAFFAQTSDNSDRFLLHFNAAGINEKLEIKPFIKYSDKKLSVFNPYKGATMLSVIDVNGKLIQSFSVNEGNGKYYCNPAKGVYLIKLENADNVFVGKVVVY